MAFAPTPPTFWRYDPESERLEPSGIHVIVPNRQALDEIPGSVAYFLRVMADMERQHVGPFRRFVLNERIEAYLREQRLPKTQYWLPVYEAFVGIVTARQCWTWIEDRASFRYVFPPSGE